MTKPYKLYSKASMAAILATAAIVPAATASAEAVQTDIATVVFEQDGKTLSLPVKEYNKAKALGTLDGTQEVKYVTDTKGNSYLASDYKKAFALNGKDKAEALNKLAADNKQQDLPNITEGKIVDGKVVTDETPSKEVKVESVKAINKTSVKVTLTEKPETTPAKEEFTVTIGEETVTVAAAVRDSSDVTGKTFVLTVNLDGKAGEVAVNGTKAEKAADFKAPQIVSITPLSTKVFDIKFDEEVNAGTAQLAKNYAMAQTGTANIVDLTGAKFTVTGKDSVRVTLVTALIAGNSYTLTAKNIQDVTTDKNASATGSSASFVAVKDESAPALVSVTALDANKVEIAFTEELGTLPTNNQVTIKQLKEDGTEDTKVFTVSSIAKSSTDATKLVVTLSNRTLLVNDGNYNVTVTGGTDLEGNALAANQKLTFNGVADVTAPTLTETKFADNKLTLTFSEDMDKTTAEKVENYRVFNTATGENVDPSAYTAVLGKDNKSVVITFDQGALTSDATYNVVINNLEDAAIVPNLLAANTKTEFTTPVVVESVVLSNALTKGYTDGKSVKLTLTGTVDATEAADVANYSIKDAKGNVLNVTKATYNAATKEVVLTTDAQVETTYTVTIANFTNLSELTSSVSKTFQGIDATKPVATAVKVVGTKVDTDDPANTETTLDIEFSEELNTDQTAAVLTAVEQGTANVKTVSRESVTKNTLRVTVKGTELGKTYLITVKDVADKATAPAANKSESQTLTFTTEADTVAPKISKVTAVNDAVIEIEFDEELVGTPAAGNLVIKKGTEAVTLGGDSTFELSSDKKKVTVTNKVSSTVTSIFENGVDYTLTFNSTVDSPVTDVAGNKVVNATATFTGVKDTTAPTLTGAVMASDSDEKVVLTFSEKLASEVNKADFTVTNTATGQAITVNQADLGTDDKANQVTLTLASSTTYGAEYKVYVNNTNNSIKDLAVGGGNVLDKTAIATATATFIGNDKTAPTVVGATLTGPTSLVLEFSEKLAASSVAKEDFVVADNTVTAAALSADGKKVTLTLGTATTVVPSSVDFATNGAVADEAGNELRKGDLAISSSISDKAAPTLKTVAVTGENDVTLTFSENVQVISDVGVIKLALDVLKADGKPNAVTAVSTTDNKIVLTVTDSVLDTAVTINLTNGNKSIKDAENNEYVADGIKAVTGLTSAEVAQTKKVADDAAVKAKVKDTTFLNTKYATKAEAETAIKELATNGTLGTTTIAWTNATAKVTLNDGTTVDFVFTDVTEVKTATEDALLAAADLSSLATEFKEDAGKTATANVVDLQGLVNKLDLDSAITATAKVVEDNYVVELTTVNATAPRVVTIVEVTTTVSEEELAAIDALLATLEYNNNNGTPSNWMDLTKLTVYATTVTADFSNGVQADIQAIYDGLGSKITDGKVQGADGVDKDAYEYAIDSYVMNTFARYLGAIGRGNVNKNDGGTYTTPVSKIIFNDVEYIWDGTLNGSNWKTTGGVTLVSAAALAEGSAIRTVNLTLVDENNYSVNVTFTATNVPTKAAIWDE